MDEVVHVKAATDIELALFDASDVVEFCSSTRGAGRPSIGISLSD